MSDAPTKDGIDPALAQKIARIVTGLSAPHAEVLGHLSRELTDNPDAAIVYAVIRRVATPEQGVVAKESVTGGYHANSDLLHAASHFVDKLAAGAAKNGCACAVCGDGKATLIAAARLLNSLFERAEALH